MKIGIFDSGLGGLLTTKRIIKELPEYDYIYLGDTKRLPYGSRSVATVYEFLKEALNFLYKRNCKLVVVACNTASAEGIDKIRKEFLPKYWPDRKVLGILVPTVERVVENKEIKRIGVLATAGTVNTGKYPQEFRKLSKNIKVYQQAAPLLVPLIENSGLKWAKPILKEYLKPLLKRRVDAIVLGCTHYPILKKMVREITGPKIKIYSQDELIARRLRIYISKKLEVRSALKRRGRREFLVTDITPTFRRRAREWFHGNIRLKLVHL